MTRGPNAATFAPGGLAAAPRWRLVGATLRFGRAKPLPFACGVILVAVALVAVFAGQVAPFPPNSNSPDILKSPSADHLAGTDAFGRDMMSRLIFGARTAMAVGAISSSVAITIWLTLGITGAYFGGTWDYVSGRLVDFIQALPGIILLISLLAIVGRGVPQVAIVLGVVSGVIGSRIVRGAAFTVASQPYVDSARAIGCSNLRICFRYMVPNVLPLVIVLATTNIGTAIIAAASLSFVGYGIRPPTADWGEMLSGQGRLFMIAAPWLFYGPTLALAVVVFSVNMLGDALRDTLDPRLRGS